MTMADIPTTPPAGAQPAAASVEPNSVTPVAEQDALSPTEAKARLDELSSDPAWRERLIAHWAKPTSPEKALFDSLTRRMADKPAEKPKSETTEAQRAMAALEPPEKVEDYRLVDYNGREIRLSADDEPVVRGEVLPTAHALGLSQGDIDMAVYGVVRPMSYDECERHLKQSWGTSFETNLDLFRNALANHPKAVELLTRYPETLGNNPFLIQRVVESFRRRQGK